MKLSKQLQYIILGIILAAAALLIVVHLLIIPLAVEKQTLLRKTEEIQLKLQSMRAVIQTRAAVQQQLNEAQERLKDLSVHIPLPVLGNYLLGLDQAIRSSGKDHNVQINQIANQDVKMLSDGPFQVYRVRVSALAGFNELVDLIESLEAHERLGAVSSLTITSREANLEQHEVAFSVAWLVWQDPDQRPAFLLMRPPGLADPAP